MSSLHFKTRLDKWVHRLYGVVGDAELRDHLVRSFCNYKDFVLTAAQMDTLNATPVEILAAPGSGIINIPVGLLLKVNSTGYTAFELGSGVLEFRYTDASGAKIVTDVVNGTVESATDLLSYHPPIVALPVANAAIVAHSSTDVTAGTGNIQGRLFYRPVKISEIV
jgi:hypothetical protein